MKQKQREALRNLSPDELKAELRQAREKKFGLAFKHRTTPLANPLELRMLRRKIAVLETHIRSKRSA